MFLAAETFNEALDFAPQARQLLVEIGHNDIFEDCVLLVLLCHGLQIVNRTAHEPGGHGAAAHKRLLHANVVSEFGRVD